ncbi:integrator complex subunit 5, partial [Oxyura jamaicensis]|uniref:integrator complex subunit 5 n=1 Tax=Oxyura jamaicensis TaxID=8884 RepID=UPI0015A685C0
ALTEVIRETRRLLASLVRSKPAAWAPAVASWAVDLLGRLSSKYPPPASSPPPRGGLNDLLQLWTSCETTRTLLDIYGQCLASLVATCPDACVDVLLDTSVQHSPHFDWVVAHVAAAFPGAVIGRVLACGLRDFCSEGGGGTTMALMTSPGDKRLPPKLASVVGILGHLASGHAAGVRRELLRLFHAGLAPAQPRGAVVFLLQLALLSPPLLGVVSAELVDSLTPPVLAQLHQRFSPLPRDDLEGLAGGLVRLLAQTADGAPRALRFLLDAAAPPAAPPAPQNDPPPVPDGVRDACERLVLLLLLHLQKLVHGRGGTGTAAAAGGGGGGGGAGGGPGDPPQRPVPFLEALRGHVRDLCLEALRLERKRCLWLHQLLGLLAVYAAPHGAPDAFFHLLALARGPEQLALATQLHAVLAPSLADLPSAAASACVRQLHAGALPPPQLARLLRNLAALTGGGGRPPLEEDPLAPQLASALARHLPELARLLLHPHPAASAAAAALLCALPAPPALRPAQLHAVLRAAVHHFFLLLRRRCRHPPAFGAAPPAEDPPPP